MRVVEKVKRGAGDRGARFRALGDHVPGTHMDRRFRKVDMLTFRAL